MLLLKKFERDTLQTAQNADAQALATVRQAVAQLQGVEGALNAFGDQYTAFLTSAATSLVVQEVNAQARAEAAPRTRQAQPDALTAPPVSPAPGVQQLQSVASKVATGRASLANTIRTLETTMQERAARIAQLSDNGGTE